MLVYQIKMNYIFFSFITNILTTSGSDQAVDKNPIENLTQSEIEILGKLYKERNIDGQMNNDQTETLDNSSKDVRVSSDIESPTLNYQSQNNFSLAYPREQANNCSLQITSAQSSFPPAPLGFYSSFLNQIVLNESTNYKTNLGLHFSDFQTQGTKQGYYNYHPQTSSQFPEQSQQKFLYEGQMAAYDRGDDPNRMMNYSNVVNQIDEVSSSSIVPNFWNSGISHSTSDIEKSIINQGIIRPEAVSGNFSSSINYEQLNHSLNYTYPQSYENVHGYQNDLTFVENHLQNTCGNDSVFHPMARNVSENQYQFQQTFNTSNEMKANDFTSQNSFHHEDCNLSSDGHLSHNSAEYYNLNQNLSNKSRLQAIGESPIIIKNQGSALEHFTVENTQMFASTNDSCASFSTKSGSTDEHLLQFDPFDQIGPEKLQNEDSQTINKLFYHARPPKNDMMKFHSHKIQENPENNTSISKNKANASFYSSPAKSSKSNDKKSDNDMSAQEFQNSASLFRTNMNIVQQQSGDSSSASFSNWCERSFNTDTNDTFYLSKFKIQKPNTTKNSLQSLNSDLPVNQPSDGVKKKKAKNHSHTNKKKNEWIEECNFMTRIIKLFGNGFILNNEDLNEEIHILEKELQRCDCLEKPFILTAQVTSMKNVSENSFYEYLINRFEKSADLLNFREFFMRRPTQRYDQIPFLNLYFHNRVKFLKNNVNSEIIPFRLFKIHKFSSVFDYRSLVLQQKDINAPCVCSLNCAHRSFTLKQHLRSVIYKFFSNEIASRIPETTGSNFFRNEHIGRPNTRSEYLGQIKSFLDHDIEADDFKIDLFTYISELNIVLISKIHNLSSIDLEVQSITKNLFYFLLKNSEIKSVLPEIRVFHQVFNLEKIRLHLESDHQQKIIANSLFWLIQFNYKKKIPDSIIQQIRINLIMPLFFSLGADIQFLKLYLFLVFKNDNLMISLIFEIYSSSGGHMFLFNEPLLENPSYGHQSSDLDSSKERSSVFVQYVRKKSEADFIFRRALRNVHREIPLMHYEYDSYRVPLMKILHRIRLENSPELSFLHLKYILLFAEENQKFKKLIPEVSCPSYFESIKREFSKKIQMIPNLKLDQKMIYHDQENPQYKYYGENSKFEVLHSSKYKYFPYTFNNNNSEEDEIDDTMEFVDGPDQNPSDFDIMISNEEASYSNIQDQYQSCGDNQIPLESLKDNQEHSQVSPDAVSRVECSVDVAEVKKQSDAGITISQNHPKSSGKNKKQSIKNVKTQKKSATRIGINEQSNITIEDKYKSAYNEITVEKKSDNANRKKLLNGAKVTKKDSKSDKIQIQSDTTIGTYIDMDHADDSFVIGRQSDNEKMIWDLPDNTKTEDVAIDSSVQDHDNKIEKREKNLFYQYKKRKHCSVPPVNEIRRSKRSKQ